MLYDSELLLQISKDGFIEMPAYVRTYLPHHLRAAIGQLRVSSHQLAIENDRARGIHCEEQTCHICLLEVASEEHFIISCPASEF